MSEHGDCFADEADRPAHDPTDAVARADLHRSRQAAFGGEVHPDNALFAARLADAVGGPTPVPLAAVPVGSVPGGPAAPAPVAALPLAPAPLAPGEPGEDGDESTVKLVPPGPGRPRPRPSPRPRPLGIVEGPASATTKAPAAVPASALLAE